MSANLSTITYMNLLRISEVKNMRSLNGFTLIELVMTLAIVAIGSSLTMTMAGAFLQDNRISIANNDLVGSINLARSSAITNGRRASICASSNGTSCTGTAWELGYIVFTDSGTAGTVDGDDQILKTSNKAAIDISITGMSTFVQFKPTGSVASTCVDCFDKITNQRLSSIFVAAIKNLTPISSAYASSGSSGSSGGSGGSGGSKISCIAPDSKVKAHGGSGSSGGGSGSSSASLTIKQYTDYALNILEQLSPISSAYADSDSDSEATCDTGEADSAQAALSESSFLLCDSSRSSESGNLISVNAAGRVSRTKVVCN